MMVIRSLMAEFVFARLAIPQGLKGIELRDGRIQSPSEDELAHLLTTYGPAVKKGDRAQITNVEIKGNRIALEINGGPRKKAKWYQRIQVTGIGGTAPAPDAPDKNPTGAIVQIAFDTRFVPEMTGDQVRDLLAPVFDFKAKSAAEAYLDTAPPKVKAAIQNHEILVGMNRQMVEFAKGRPGKKIRERDESGKEYEEWLYGQPPQEVQFVRFRGDEVVRLEIMKVDGGTIIRTEKEVEVRQPETTSSPGSASPTEPPALHRSREATSNPSSVGAQLRPSY